jgi:hypothetical protein
MACSKGSNVRAAFARRSALTLDQHSSIGEKSGEYGGQDGIADLCPCEREGCQGGTRPIRGQRHVHWGVPAP